MAESRASRSTLCASQASESEPESRSTQVFCVPRRVGPAVHTCACLPLLVYLGRQLDSPSLLPVHSSDCAVYAPCIMISEFPRACGLALRAPPSPRDPRGTTHPSGAPWYPARPGPGLRVLLFGRVPVSARGRAGRRPPRRCILCDAVVPAASLLARADSGRTYV